MNSLILREVVKLPFAPSILAFVRYTTSNSSLAVAGAGWRNVYSRVLQLFYSFPSFGNQDRREVSGFSLVSDAAQQINSKRLSRS